MVQLALIAAMSFAPQTQQRIQDLDVWWCPRIDITGCTNLDSTPSPAHYDPRDAFGGTYGNVRGEGGHIVFEDNSGGPGHPDFIEWNTKEPVSINRMLLSWQDDSPGNDWRNLAGFAIFARRFADENWRIIWRENTPSQVGHYTVTKNISPEVFQYFRAEFIRGGATNATAVGPRICAIEAYGHEVHP